MFWAGATVDCDAEPKISARSVYRLNCSTSLFLIVVASSSRPACNAASASCHLFHDVLATVFDCIFELCDALQSQQVPFSLVGIVGFDLLGEILPLADGGQVIATAACARRRAHGRSQIFVRHCPSAGSS